MSLERLGLALDVTVLKVDMEESNVLIIDFISDPESVTVLASLSLIQELRNEDIEGWSEYIGGMPHFEFVEPLADFEIDSMCEKLNTGRPRQIGKEGSLDE